MNPDITLLNNRNSYFGFTLVTPDLVTKLLSSSSSNTLGVDYIPACYYTLALPFLVLLVVEIIIKSLSTSVFSSFWKKAFIILIPKLDKPAAPKDYRPISILCSLSQVLEAVVYKQLLAYLVETNLLDPRQSGFKMDHSIQTVLLRLVDDVRTAMKKRLITILVFS